MATSALMERQRKALLKKFHTLLGLAGIGEAGKREILASYGVVEDMAYVKAMASHGAGADHFNALSKQKLINLYNNFKEKNKQLKYINKLTRDELDIAGWVN